MQQQFLSEASSRPARRSKWLRRPVLGAAITLVVLVGCDRTSQRIDSGGDIAVDNSRDVAVTSSGVGTPILVTDQITQPLGLDGVPVDELSKALFQVEYVSSLRVSPKLYAFTDFSLVGLVYENTDFGSLIVKEGQNPQPSDFDAIVKVLDDPATPERYGVDPSNGHEYLGVDTKYGTALVEGVNGYVSVHFNLDGVFAEITGIEKLLTFENASKLASTLVFSTGLQ